MDSLGDTTITMGKGSNAERELARIAWEEYDWATLRAPGSGSIKRPSPDVAFIKTEYKRDYGVYEKQHHTDVIAIELKNHPDGTATFKEKEIKDLETWADKAGAIAMVGVKPDLRKHDQWYFCETSGLTNSYGLTKEHQKTAPGIEEVFG